MQPTCIVRNIIRNGKSCDILLAKDKILKIVSVQEGKDIVATETEIDGKGLVAFPSMIDAHVHLREPGYSYKETIATGLAAALAGGFGQVMPMANTKPVNDMGAITTSMLSKAKLAFPGGPWIRPIGAATTGLKGEQLAPMGELAEAGCVAFSNDGSPVMNAELFRRAMEYASDFGLKIIDHCEDSWLGKNGIANEGKVSSKLGLHGIPVVAESLQVARDILLSEYLNIPVHLAHISTKQSVMLIAFAKEKGIAVSAETCPHYLLLDETSLEGYNALAKVNPPLRTKEDVLAVREAVQNGTIDILCTDHAPHADFEKYTTMEEAANGISGLDTAFALTCQLVREKLIDTARLEELWIKNPARLFNLPINNFVSGDSADFFLADLEKVWEVTEESMFSQGKNTPWLGKNVQGQVMMHFLQGKLLYKR